MDPEPGRVVTWVMSRARWLIWLGGVLGFGAAGVMFFVANPATLSTGADQTYGPDAPLQPWNLFFGVVLLLCAAALLVLIPYLLVLRRRSARCTAQPAGAAGSEIDGGPNA
jgi:drug/metabolite transporter (DMT)-like permease